MELEYWMCCDACETEVQVLVMDSNEKPVYCAMCQSPMVYTELDDEDELDDIEGTQMGLIAQQVEPIVPEIVEVDKEGMYNLNYGNLAGLFVESIKELKQEVDDLKKEIQELKNGNSK